MCEKMKPIDNFGPGFGTHKRHTYCRLCYNAYKRDRYSNNRLAEIERSKKWNRDNPEAVARNMKKCRDARPDFYREYKRTYVKNNPEKATIWNHKKRIKRNTAILGTKSTITAQEWQTILTKQRGICYYCRRKFPKLQMEHKIPLSRGGDHSVKNIVGACKSCNCRKHAKTPEEFANAQRRRKK